MKKYCFGIDVDKKTFKVCLILRDSDLQKKVRASKTFANNLSGFKLFQLWIVKHTKHHGALESYVMEATGVYHEQLAYFLNSHQKHVHIVLPLKSKRYLQSLGYRGKTDKIDAKGLAMMGCEQDLSLWEPPSCLLYTSPSPRDRG